MAAATAAPQVAIITTLGCPYCKKAKAAMQAAGIPYQEYELSEQLEVLSKIKATTGQSTVPQIFVGGKLLGGASDVVPLAQSGGLQQLLASTQGPPLPAELQAVVEQAVADGAEAEAAQAEEGPSPQLRQLAADLRAAQLGAGAGAAFGLRRAAEWLQGSRGLAPGAAAAALGELQAAQLLTVADASAADQPITAGLLQGRPQLPLLLVADAPQPTRWKEPLNGQVVWFGLARPAAEVAESLRKRILQLYDKYLQDGGKKVNYRALKADPAFAEFAAATAELQKVDLSGLATREQRMAFFINIYNALVVHALVVFGAADSSLSRLKWFDSISYLIGGRRWSSNDVEHGVLRGNAPSPASLFALLGKPQWAGATFKAGDPRAALAVKPVDPRIHFALNCGAASCPPIRIYTPESLDFGLAAAASAFCEVQVDKAAGELELSMILKWYGPDFGSKAQLLQFLVQYLPPGPQADLKELLAGRSAEDVKLRYRPYDWTTNSTD
ncbi:hypothetical protein CHLNCDRAFT_137357 [Chlorella variabilis]|uniref:GST N-terminal domain-containing protein n=1 Tax=Chlorella variabilis TaxID=554065 RepID=E1ZM91_CHLVA|nr:hypothetical protein CHLNCDRAFT_137357 [Chlorella variabilis]EFN52965.1 hypothetical protein CHLNCDRAFT_137357 [Chlorella variabilis]|eukprot:XP_005845067.1 hypothetical protein CHLNCDRAFT_137357 [Chlorella variabilis]